MATDRTYSDNELISIIIGIQCEMLEGDLQASILSEEEASALYNIAKESSNSGKFTVNIPCIDKTISLYVCDGKPDFSDVDRAIGEEARMRIITSFRAGNGRTYHKTLVNFASRICPCLMIVLIFAALNHSYGASDCVVVDGVRWYYINDQLVNKGGTWEGVYKFSEHDDPTLNTAVETISHSGVIEMPSYLGGHKITEIGPLAFCGCTNLSVLIVPATIKYVNPMAFATGSITNDAWMTGSTTTTMRSYYATVYERGGSISNLYFKGDAPSFQFYELLTCENLGEVNVGAGCGRPFDSIYNNWYRIWRWAMRRYKDPLEDVTCWADVETKGWDTTKKWYGATVKYAPSEVTIAPDETSAETVTISCVNPNASIFYTLDGSDPEPGETLVCHRYTGSFSITHKKTTVRAISYVDGFPLTPPSDERTYNAQGIAIAPEVEGSMGTEFWYSDNLITLTTKTPDAYIRYTLDGSDVTAKSPLYTEPFAISKTTTVRAKSFKEDWFDSEETVQTFTREWHTNETPVVSAASDTFSSTAHEVTLSCATEDATIYYTIGGGEPDETYGRKYEGPFYIYDTATVKAIAVKGDWKDSAVASRTFTKVGSLGPAIDFIEVHPDNDKTHPWTVVTDITHDGISAVKSGDIEDEESTTLKVVIYGAGQLSFWWRTSCEPSIDGEYYDYATFYNGTTVVTNLAGVTDWQRVTLDVPGTGKHTFKWTYQKDDSGSMAPDGMWLDQVQWLPETTDYYSDHTLTTDTPVPYRWLMHYGFGMATGFEVAANSKTGKRDAFGRELTVEADYVAGTDPTNVMSQLTSYIEMGDDGPHVTWEPNHVGERVYKLWGKAELDDAKWQWPTNALHRFFKVTVEMPK